MASHTRGPRGRSRKPRPAGASTTGAPTADGAGSEAREPASGRRAGGSRTQRRSDTRRPVPAQTTYGERPPAPWHPLPLSEILILVGAVAFVLAVSRLGRHHGGSSVGPLLLVGLLAVALGTFEVTWREHRSGFRSHTLLLALMPVIVLHSVVVLGFASLSKPSQILNVGMFAVDIAVFVFLFRLLRARFLDERARAASRR